jgi:multidrug resistance efflux pump
MKVFYAGTGVVIVALAFMSMQWRGGVGKITSFYGVVDTLETVVSAELAVEIIRLHVVPGQLVNAGDPLVDLASSELERNIAELRHSLNEARAARLAGDREIQAQVAEYEAQYKLNRSLLSQVVRGGRDDQAEDAGESPLGAAIAGLKGMLSREELSTVDMEAYLSLLLREKEKLTVVAPGPGVIGTVHRRAGEKVKAFESVLTLYTGAPTTVRGYIHESAHGEVQNGHIVAVRSLASKYQVVGEVIGIGHRIVEYPVRLRKRADIQMWGREVIIRIPDSNSFLLGEKVMIDMRAGKSAPASESRTVFPGLSAHASDPAGDAVGASKTTASLSSHGDWVLPDVEASGLVYLADVRKFLVISDDTPKKRAHLHVVAPDGTLEGTTEIQGLPAINDMESIAQDASGRIYVGTSMSRNKSGKFPQTRQLLVRAVRGSATGTDLKLDASVHLHDALSAAAAGNSASWAQWFRTATQTGTLDMEGMTLHGSGLLLGFKAPLLNENAVILMVHDREGLFSGKPLAQGGVSLWDTLALKAHGENKPHGISDLFYRDGHLHVLGTAVSENADDGVIGGGGGWWTLQPGKPLRFIQEFPGMKPEGIAFDPHVSAWRIALDEGSSKPSRVLVVRPALP